MNTQNTNTQAEAKVQGQFVEPKAYLKGEYLTLVIDGNILVRKHVNYFKKILGIEFTPKQVVQPAKAQA